MKPLTMRGIFSLNYSLNDCVWRIAWLLKQMGAALIFALGLGDLMVDIMLCVVTQAAAALDLHFHVSSITKPQVLTMQFTFHSNNRSFD